MPKPSLQHIVCACVLTSCCAAGSAAVIPAEDLEIKGVGSGKITITGIRDGVTLSGDVEIPASITVMDGSKPVAMPVVAIGAEYRSIDNHPATPAFYNQPGITSVTIPASVESIGDREFLGCTGIESFTVKEGNPTFHVDNGALMCAGDNSHDMVFKVPPATRKTWFTVPKDCETAPWAFADVRNIKKIRFYGWSALYLPLLGNASVTEFEMADKDDSYTVKDGIIYRTDDGKEGSGQYEMLVRVPPAKYVGGTFRIPAGVKILSDYCMASCRFEYVDFGSTPLSLGTSAHAATPFGDEVFRGSSLREVTLPADMTLGKGYGSPTAMFMDCKDLEKAIINMPLAKTGQRMFEGCTSLSSVTLHPKTRISTYAFYGCTSLKRINGANLPTDDSAGQFARSGLTSFNMGSAWTSVPYDMFMGCESLREVTVGEKVSGINGWAFYESGLASIDTRNVDYIGPNAFAGCAALQKIVLPDNGNTLYMDLNSFSSLPEGCDIYIDRKEMRYGEPENSSEEWPGAFDIEPDAKPVIYSSLLAPAQFIAEYSQLYIPGATLGYRQWPGWQQEMYSYVLSVSPLSQGNTHGIITIDTTPLINGVEIEEIKINNNYGFRNESGLWQSHFPEAVDGNFPVTLSYTVNGVAMTTVYPASFNRKVISTTTAADAVEASHATITLDGLTLRFPAAEAWEVTDVSGSVVLSGTAVLADISQLQPGIYIARQGRLTLKFAKKPLL